MPKHKSSKNYNPSAMDVYLKIDSDIDKEIFFNYYIGYTSGGIQGYKVTKKHPEGSTTHREGGVGMVYTKNQFRSKGKKLALLAKRFLQTKESPEGEVFPPLEERPTFTEAEIKGMVEDRKDKRTLLQKYEDELKDMDPREFFIFFMYYDGFKSKIAREKDPRAEKKGFDLAAGDPGSVNHQRAYSRLSPMQNFRDRAKILGVLAKNFVENKEEPPADRPEELTPPPLLAMIREAELQMGLVTIN